VGIAILLLLLLAAATGVLGAVLKVTLVLVLSLILAIVLLAWIGMWYARRRFRAFQRDLEIRIDQEQRRREAYDVGQTRGEASLGDGR
jgi:hypothetical protein